MVCSDWIQNVTIGGTASFMGGSAKVLRMNFYPFWVEYDITTPVGNFYPSVRIDRMAIWSIEEYDPTKGEQYIFSVQSGSQSYTYKNVDVNICYEVVPITRFGSVDIKSDPAGANIFIDGSDTGKITPAVISLSAETHIITYKLDRYDDYVQNINVLADQTIYVSATLVFNPIQECTDISQIRAGSTFSDKFGGKVTLIATSPPNAIVNVVTPWGEVFNNVSITENIQKIFKKNYLAYTINPANVYALDALDLYTCYLDATPPTCVPVWICEEPRTGYEVDGCGSRRYNPDCEPEIVPPPCVPVWTCEEPRTGYEVDGCGGRRYNPDCEPEIVPPPEPIVIDLKKVAVVLIITVILFLYFFVKKS